MWEKHTSTTGQRTARTNGLQDGARAESYPGLQGKIAFHSGNAAAAFRSGNAGLCCPRPVDVSVC